MDQRNLNRSFNQTAAARFRPAPEQEQEDQAKFHGSASQLRSGFTTAAVEPLEELDTPARRFTVHNPEIRSNEWVGGFDPSYVVNYRRQLERKKKIKIDGYN